MGSTPDCGPHCSAPGPRETHCSCSQCHGKPIRALEGMVIADALITPEMPILEGMVFNWQIMRMERLCNG